MNKMKYIHFLSLGAMAFEQGAYGTHTIATTANQIADQLLAKIDVDRHSWYLEQKKMYGNNGSQKIGNWIRQITTIQIAISMAHEKAEHGLWHIAKSYADFFFSELNSKEQENKCTEVLQILINGRNNPIDHQTLTANACGNEDFSEQVFDPIRQLIANAIGEALERGRLNLSDNAAVQDFFEKIVIFSAIVQGVIVAVTDSDNMNNFGMPMDINCLDLSIDIISDSPQARYMQWMRSRNSPEINDFRMPVANGCFTEPFTEKTKNMGKK
jgi:hypothetical protein